ncbi:LysE family translocator [Flavobacteriaceae bacterium]|jgi:threonine/homoserine/homoserine lactone efflux protein|nr:LysE family translocator [Flavobacteriaceae bacterium]MDA7724053.1 LysE family translocator [Flavobacteriaceae bacterium]MDA7727575.1 LysE family translocator [Flavobacteriaceae bacterium]MDB0004107.1 LysE family translocator [Flavobacteriaceae bacterium]MDG1309353.1 LysE family transporter [Flavobacteriaceae bacterium]
MIDDIQAAIPLGFFLAFMIGPVFFVLIETSVTKGFRAAVAFDLGVIIADIIFIGVAYFSSFQLLENLSNQPGLYVFGGTILAVYGLIIFLKKPKRNDLKAQLSKSFKVNYIELFIKGFLLNFINVGVLIFWLGIIIVTGPSLENDINRFYVFFGSLIVAYFITDLFKILLAKQLKKQLTPKIILKIKKLLGIILLICGMVLITKGFLPKDKLNPQTIIEEIRE